MKNRRVLIPVVCLICIGVVLGVVFTRNASPASPQDTVLVTRGDIVKTVFVDGSLEMPNKAYLSFGVTGTVSEVLVSEGSNVTKGQVLARLDAPSLRSSVDLAELQVKVAQEQVKQARAQYDIALVNLDNAGKSPLGESKEVLELRVDMAKASWETAKLNLEVTKLNLQTAKLNLEKATIVAPFAGIIADITISQGKEIAAGTLATPAITLVDTRSIQMRGFIDEIDVAMVKIGQAASITLDALPNKGLDGKVAFVSPTGTVRAGIVSYETKITLENPAANLRDGMTATAEVILEKREDVLVIPHRAIRGTLANPKVMVLVDGQEQERQITLGLSDGINTEVVAGLEEGEEVVLPAARERPGNFFTT